MDKSLYLNIKTSNRHDFRQTDRSSDFWSSNFIFLIGRIISKIDSLTIRIITYFSLPYILRSNSVNGVNKFKFKTCYEKTKKKTNQVF